MSTQQFHFFIGPVHEFVASARRTRDFQAGSVLLSWLTAVAAYTAQKCAPQANDLFPPLEADLISALEQGGAARTSMPNRFSISVDETFDPQTIEKAVRNAWRALAAAVWRNDIKPVLSGEDLERAKAVWDRQVDRFWEIYWIVAPQDAPFAMDWRKNWRTPEPLEEPGAKCSQMTGLQELSGIEAMDRKAQKARRAFWNALSERLGNDLAEDEQLSAIALIKRRLYKYFDQVEVQVTPEHTIRGLSVSRQVPSAPLLAATPTLLALDANDPAISTLLDEIREKWKKLTGGSGEGERQCWSTKPPHPALYIDGQAWFEKTYDNPQGYGLQGDKKQLNEIKQKVQTLWKNVGVQPQPFYALLSMDGDSLGKQMGDPSKRPYISEALSAFTQQVPDIVEAHHGHLVYAGGDDVMALLPPDRALSCAVALRKAYMAAFEAVNERVTGETIKTTISAAILLAPYDRPLSRMLDRVFELLDSVSKDHTGRDAVTVEILKGSGRHLLWTQPWDHALKGDELVVEELARRFASSDDTLSHRFYYRLIDYVERLAPELRQKRDMSSRTDVDRAQGASSGRNTLDVNEMILKMWAVALVQSPVHSSNNFEDARKAIEELFRQCVPHVRDADSGKVGPLGVVRPDGALLVKFLAQFGHVNSRGDEA